jgi:hypothetical protein
MAEGTAAAADPARTTEPPVHGADEPGCAADDGQHRSGGSGQTATRDDGAVVKGEPLGRESGQAPLRDAERSNYRFFLDLPETSRTEMTRIDNKTSQFLEPLFEYSGARSGCGETPYLKRLTQLFGDRLLIANVCRVKQAVRNPVIASLNAVTAEGWPAYAQLLEVHSALDVIKATMAGPTSHNWCRRCCSTAPAIREGIETWMREHEWASLGEMRGNMGLERIPDPAAYERANLRMVLK